MGHFRGNRANRSGAAEGAEFGFALFRGKTGASILVNEPPEGSGDLKRNASRNLSASISPANAFHRLLW
jgi:hypothetical protein